MRRLIVSAVLTATLLGLVACSEENEKLEQEEAEEVVQQPTEKEKSKEEFNRLTEELESLDNMESIDAFLLRLDANAQLNEKDLKKLKKTAQSKKDKLASGEAEAEMVRLTTKLEELTTASTIATFVKNIEGNEMWSEKDLQKLKEAAETKRADLLEQEQLAEVERLEGILAQKNTAGELDTFYTNVGANLVLTDDRKLALQQKITNKKEEWVATQEAEVQRLQTLLANKTTGSELEIFKQNIGTNTVLSDDRKRALQQQTEQKRQQWVAAQQPKQSPRSKGGGGGVSGTVQNNIHNTPAPKDQTPQRFANCTEMRKVYPNGVPSTHPSYQAKHDRDKDGWACER